MSNTNLIIGGDLNFSIGQAETWGPAAHSDPLSDFFSSKIKDGKLIDINLLKITGEARVAKILDRFLIKEDPVDRIPMLRQWIGEGGDSDHHPILLELKGPYDKPGSPFKFNHRWLKEESYNSLFKGVWIPLGEEKDTSKQPIFWIILSR